MKNEAVIGGITVGGQPSPEELMSGRFGHVVNIRGAEEAGNVTGEVLAGSDVAYTSVPWTIDTVTNEDIDRMREAISASEGPVLIHWAGGTRAAVAAAIITAREGGTGAEGALEAVAGAGFEITGTPYADFIRRYFAGR